MWNMSRRKKRIISMVGLVLVLTLVVTSIVSAFLV